MRYTRAKAENAVLMPEGVFTLLRMAVHVLQRDGCGPLAAVTFWWEKGDTAFHVLGVAKETL